jgi:hypothetical protein
MTRQDEHHHRTAKRHAGGRPWRWRLLAGVAVLVCVLAGFLALSDRKDLPPNLRNSPVVIGVYGERDAILRATTAMLGLPDAAEAPADANADMKQLGYPRNDRAKLDTIISKGKTPE